MLDFSGQKNLRQQTEQDRLSELNDYAIFGTAPENRFDSIARAAGTLLKTPMAFMTLVGEDSQWYKAAHGAAISQSPRAISFCHHTIMSDDVMVIQDATGDARFSDNPLVTGDPKIRFYAGAPLITASGFRIGALCVLDTVPRELTTEQRLVLKDLASLAMTQIEARRGELSTIALSGLAQSLGQPLLAVNASGTIEFANRPAADFFGIEHDVIKGRPLDQVLSSGRLGFGAAALIETFREARANVVSRPLRRTAVRGDGSEVPVDITVSRWDAPSGIGLSVVIKDLAVETANALNSAMVKLQKTDSVGDRRLEMSLEDVFRRGTQASLLLLTLDGFDELCDALGRQTGTRVLQSVMVRLQRLLPGAVIGTPERSDYFVIVAKGAGSEDRARSIGETILSSFDEPVDLGTRFFQLTASIGIAVAGRHGSSRTELLANAEMSLHDIRRRGGRGMQIYDPKLRTRSVERHQIQQELTQALKQQQFRLFYQPQVSLQDGKVIGVEALIRWQHPTRGLLAPQDFLLDIEEGNLSLAVGWWVLETACIQLAAWRDAGIGDIRMGVNLFSTQFRSERLVPMVTELLTRYELAPGQLELEVTETIALLNDETGLESLRKLRDMGVGIAFDDFGTGYASLSSLQHFPLTTLKLDRSFVRNILTHPNDAVITRSMIAMANELGLSTVAEGVETEEQEAMLRQYGCRHGQGYLYSRPVAAEAATRLLLGSPVAEEVAVRRRRG